VAASGSTHFRHRFELVGIDRFPSPMGRTAPVYSGCSLLQAVGPEGRGALLRRAFLADADLTGARLTGAILTGTTITAEQRASARNVAAVAATGAELSSAQEQS
jgi:uncharacterized protein YjbI with pentapeptide repeats